MHPIKVLDQKLNLKEDTSIYEIDPINGFLKFNIDEYKELEIFKYSGLKNSKILIILSSLSILVGLFLVFIFYNLSSNLKNAYLELKSNYTSDDKYLAVITKNGLWIKDKIDDKIR